MIISFLRKNAGFLVVLSSSMIGMGIGFLINIYSTYIMQSDIFGGYKAILTTSQILATVMTFGFHYTISRDIALNPNNSSSSIGFAILYTLFITVFVQLIALILMFFWRQQLSEIMGVIYAPLVSSATILLYFTQQIFSANQKSIKYSLVTILPQVFMLISLVVLHSVIEFNTIILSLIFLVSNGLSFAIVLYNRKGYCINRESINIILSMNRGYGFRIYVGSLIPVVYSQILGLLIIPFTNYSEYAFYSLGMALASPIVFISSSYLAITYKAIVNSHESLTKHSINIFFLTLLGSIGLVTILNLILPFIIPQSYSKAVDYANIFVLFYSLWGIGDFHIKLVAARGFATQVRNNSIINGVAMLVVSIPLIIILGFYGVVLSKLVSAVIYSSSTLLLNHKIRSKYGNNRL